MLQWDDPVGFVKGATPSVRKAWQSLGIQTIGDLLQTPPRRYDDYSRTVRIADAEPGTVVTIGGKVEKASKLPTFRKNMAIIRVTVADESGKITANFFNQLWLLEELKPGREIFLSGKVDLHPKFGKRIVSPLWEPAEAKTLAAGKIAPVYPLSGSLAQKTYRRLLALALEEIAPQVDPLPADMRDRLQLLEWMEAVKQVHSPANVEEAEAGRERLAFDELLTYQLAMGSTVRDADEAGAPAITFDEAFAKKFVSGLPYPLTADQKRAAWAALQDMAAEKPMRRLLQGDVGSGKTVVAAFLAACTHRAQASAVLLAPTDLLAKQHGETFHRFLTPYHVPCLLITRTEKRLWEGADSRELTPAEAEKIAQRGNVVVVGTHALLVRNRLPPDTALAIVDEQHRFGVEQRETIVAESRPDGRVPHLLSMTATPIPRSLALTLYGDLEVSIIREKPIGRANIKTSLALGEGREKAYQAIREAVGRKERAFVVCPLIDPSDALGVRSVTEEAKRLEKESLSGLRLGVLHGKKKADEKDEIMAQFSRGELDVLVATSVIEVGIDVPEATVILIEGAERFGLAQLHQLRGRVGRSSRPSSCWLLTDAEGPALDRLKLMENISDGFRLAEEDLKLRGSGDLLGTVQSGAADFRAARWTDLRLMAAARDEGKQMLDKDRTLAAWPAWQKRLEHLRETTHLE